MVIVMAEDGLGRPSYLPEMDYHEPGWAASIPLEMAAFAEEHSDALTMSARSARFLKDIYTEQGRRGWISAIAPSEFGGLGGGVSDYCWVVECVARYGLITPQVAYQGQRWLLDWGSDEQRRRYLGPLARGECIFSESISEPGMGSSFRNMKATATASGSDWIIDGEKTHVNLGAQSDVTLVYAIAEAGLTAFLVDMTTPGIHAEQTDPIGLRMMPTADVHFESVRVPESAVLGEPGRGLDTFFTTFNMSRLGNASELLGMARRALSLGVAYARERHVGESTVTEFQGIQWTIADLAASIYSASLVRNRAATTFQSEDMPLQSALAKSAASIVAERTTNEVFALTGGYGLYNDVPFGQLLFDSKTLRVAGGSLEVLRNYVAKQVLADPEWLGL